MYGLSTFSGNLLPVQVINFKLGYISFRVVVGYAMFEYCANRWGIVFFDPAFQSSTWFSNVRRIAILINTGPLINHILVQLYWNFVFGMQ